jgi:hypothetical protein
MKCYVLHDSSDSPSLLVTIFCHDSLSMVKTGLAVLCDWSPWSFINAHALVVIHIHHRRRRGAKLSAIESFHFLINRKKYLAEHPITFTTKITTRGTDIADTITYVSVIIRTAQSRVEQTDIPPTSRSARIYLDIKHHDASRNNALARPPGLHLLRSRSLAQHLHIFAQGSA